MDELLVPMSFPTGNILIDGLGREGNDSGRMQEYLRVWWGNLITGVGQASKQDYLRFRKLVKCQRNIQRWGVEENTVALRLQTRCLEGCEIPQPKARDHAALSQRWPRRLL